MPKILLAEDHTLFRKAMINLLQTFGMQVQGAEDGVEGLLMLSKEKFDLVITDLQMPKMDGGEFCLEIKRLYPDQRIIVLTMHDSFKFVKFMIEVGVQGYLIKNVEPDELEIAINEVLKGKTYFPQDITAMLVQGLIIKPKKAESAPSFTERELHILRLIAAEKTVAEIAQELFISPRTVESYKLKMIEKANVKSTIGLVKMGVVNGLI
jgi:DNA-binding NarL/FixJ family response regulator